MISLAVAIAYIAAAKYSKPFDEEIFVITGFFDLIIVFLVTMAIGTTGG